MKNKDSKLVIVDYFSVWVWMSLLFVAIGIVVEDTIAILTILAVVNTSIYVYFTVYVCKVRSWIACDGICLKSEVEKIYIQNLGRSLQERYKPACEYTYQIKDIKFRNNQIGIVNHDFNYPREGMKLVQRILFRFPKGEVITVYYNPKKPSQSTLLLELSDVKKLQLNILFGVGVVCWLYAGYRLL